MCLNPVASFVRVRCWSDSLIRKQGPEHSEKGSLLRKQRPFSGLAAHVEWRLSRPIVEGLVRQAGVVFAGLRVSNGDVACDKRLVRVSNWHVACVKRLVRVSSWHVACPTTGACVELARGVSNDWCVCRAGTWRVSNAWCVCRAGTWRVQRLVRVSSWHVACPTTDACVELARGVSNDWCVCRTGRGLLWGGVQGRSGGPLPV